MDTVWSLLPLTGLLSSPSFSHMLQSSCSCLLAAPHTHQACPEIFALAAPSLRNVFPRPPHGSLPHLPQSLSKGHFLNEWTLSGAASSLSLLYFSLQPSSPFERLHILCIYLSCFTNESSMRVEGLCCVGHCLSSSAWCGIDTWYMYVKPWTTQIWIVRVYWHVVAFNKHCNCIFSSLCFSE